MEEIGVAEIDDHARQDRQAQADAQDPAHRAELLALTGLLGVQVRVTVLHGRHDLLSYSAA